MASPAVNARRRAKDVAVSMLPDPSIARRIAWVLAMGAWVFLFISLASFDSADAPSHVVAVHNAPPANLCGGAGAAIAYWGYQVLGIGAWVVLGGLAMLLWVTVHGRVLTQPLVRSLGMVIMAVAVFFFALPMLTPWWRRRRGTPAAAPAEAGAERRDPRA